MIGYQGFSRVMNVGENRYQWAEFRKYQTVFRNILKIRNKSRKMGKPLASLLESL